MQNTWGYQILSTKVEDLHQQAHPKAGLCPSLACAWSEAEYANGRSHQYPATRLQNYAQLHRNATHLFVHYICML